MIVLGQTSIQYIGDSERAEQGSRKRGSRDEAGSGLKSREGRTTDRGKVARV